MSERLFIGQFNDSYKPIMDGVGVCAENYARWINANHGKGVAIVPSQPRFEDRDEFEVIRFASLPFVFMHPYRVGVPWMSPSVGSRLRDLKFDLVHSHTPFVGGRMARRAARYHHIPHVTTFHTKYRDDAMKILHNDRLADEVVRRIVKFYRTVDAVWTPSESTAQTLREYGFDGEVAVAPNGSDMAIPTGSERESLRRRGEELCGLRPAEFMLLFVGQHRWEKNVRLIINAISRLDGMLREEGATKPFRMVFAGDGYAATAMRAMCEDLGIARRTAFLGKIVDRDALQSLFARADLFVFPSIYDNAPLVMREASAFSLPTVVAAGSATAEIVRDGENGFITEDEPEAMARRLKLLMGQPELLRRAGQGATRTIYLSWEEIVDWAADQYRAIIDRFV
ncbi:MAG: glycosyltransferase [Spirochaetales bacterium]|nr:glycosyltransferase [Spirochaetales bacterium]